MFKNIKTIIRIWQPTVQGRNYVRRSARGAPNPGIQKQLRHFDELPEHIEEDPEDINRYESDFMTADLSHRQIEKEEIQQRERIRHRLVRQKYFNKKLPNFLSWSEKEQIRYLHSSDAEEWNIEKLSESFPADQQSIAKIVKAAWVPRDFKRIQKHDEGARRSWSLLKSGGLKDLNPKLLEHLDKFSKRDLPIAKPNENNITIRKLPEPPGNEFSSIITSCKKYIEAPTPHVNPFKTTDEPLDVPESRTMIRGEIRNRKPMLYSEFDKSKAATENYQTLENPMRNPEGTGIVELADDQLNTFNVKKYNSQELQADDVKNITMPAIRDQIFIPKRLYQPGATYQLNDCFYDDDGEFLYRVPGMTGRKK